MVHKISKFDRLVIQASVFANICAIILFSYKENFTLIPKILAIFLFVQYAYYAFGKKWSMFFPREYRLLVAWFAWACLCTILADYSDTVVSKVLTLLQVYGISFILFQFVTRLKLIDTVCYSLIFSLYISTFIALAGVGDVSTIEGRVFATLANPNIYGVALIFGIAMSAHLILTGRRSFIVRVILIGGVVLFFYMILSTGSRKALLGSLLIILFFAYGFYQSNLKGKPLMVALLIIAGFSSVLIGSIAIYNSEHFGRIERIYNAVESGDKNKAGASEIGRLRLYEIGLNKIWSSPLIGHGLDSFRSIDFDNFGRSVGTYSHSNYIEIGVTTGIVGLLLYYAAMFSVLIRVIFSKLKSGNYVLASTYSLVMPLMSMQLIFDFALVSYYEKIFWLFNTFMISFAYIHARELKSATKIKKNFSK